MFAIHGLGSDPNSAWTYKLRDSVESRVAWLKDILPYQGTGKHIRVAMINHHTRWDSHVSNMDPDAHAKTMLDEMVSLNQVQIFPIIQLSDRFLTIAGPSPDRVYCTQLWRCHIEKGEY